MQQQSFTNFQLPPDTSQQSVGTVLQALRQERNLLRFDFEHNIVQNQYRDYYKILAQKLAEMTLSLNTILYLQKNKSILSSMSEFFQDVGVDLNNINYQWKQNNKKLMKEKQQYNKYYNELLQQFRLRVR